ncbi:hypothetical protein J1N35_034739 [Gossypium stocksii]|uniref:Uncharacterized protein n=1 Tax=Gossypium stocksii TaxID=47602 RepID=A0A9D3UUI2_9ROSI|nr:hypothetical protein J1N35_034739 [Gossypium stocksii]
MEKKYVEVIEVESSTKPLETEGTFLNLRLHESPCMVRLTIWLSLLPHKSRRRQLKENQKRPENRWVLWMPLDYKPRVSGGKADEIIARLGFQHSHRVEDIGFSSGI